MYTVIINPEPNRKTYFLELISADSSHCINVAITDENGCLSVWVSKSIDNFTFCSPCSEGDNLPSINDRNLDEAYEVINNYFLQLNYKNVNKN